MNRPSNFQSVSVVVSLGSGADAVQTPDVPEYPEMFRYVCGILDGTPKNLTCTVCGWRFRCSART